MKVKVLVTHLSGVQTYVENSVADYPDEQVPQAEANGLVSRVSGGKSESGPAEDKSAGKARKTKSKK